uniref:Uncharacterized protein n=1 Tax=Anguilla anguilla TaxID=7936 RepID=A0A0E9PP51_ANGAN
MQWADVLCLLRQACLNICALFQSPEQEQFCKCAAENRKILISA